MIIMRRQMVVQVLYQCPALELARRRQLALSLYPIREITRQKLGSCYQ